MTATLLWFRQDLRLADHEALTAAALRGGPVIPVYVWAPKEEGEWQPGAASRWWLHHSLASLETALRVRGSRLVLKQGPPAEILLDLARSSGASAVYWSHRYEPSASMQDAAVEKALVAAGMEVRRFSSGLLVEPWAIRNQSGKPFQVFTPFWRACLAALDPASPLPAPAHLPQPRQWPVADRLETWELLPKPDWAEGMRAAWKPGEQGAAEHLTRFLQDAADRYAEDRDRPDRCGTSRLSPHLHFGETSPRQVWNAFRTHAESRSQSSTSWRQDRFLTELGWREFAHHLLHHFPGTSNQPLREEFKSFPWHPDPERLRAWQQGRTGYPLVDAGMRELWISGWMHNRVRMVVASFLVKHLLIPWREGARWFWDTLVDADLANNTLGWQWSAGCGADAAPYFRIFNPVIQGKKFDPEGVYVRQWVPELARLPGAWVHKPWEAPSHILSSARIELGRHYPRPMVSHTIAREVALQAYARMRKE